MDVLVRRWNHEWPKEKKKDSPALAGRIILAAFTQCVQERILPSEP